MSTLGKIVVIVRSVESTTRVPTTSAASAFSQRGLTHGPSTSWSLHGSSRNTVALGRSTPASACTPIVISPSGAPGISTIIAASATNAT